MRFLPDRLVASPVRRAAGWRRVLSAAVLVVVACGQAPDASPGSDVSPTTPAAGSAVAPDGDTGSGEERGDRLFRDESWEFPACADLPKLAAPPEAYRDKPIYVSNEAPVEEVKAWAESQPGYEEIWLDWDHNGWISVAFSRGAAARQEDLEEEFPSVGVVAVPVERTKAELEAIAGRLQRELAPFLAELNMFSAGASTHKGVAHLSVGVLTEEFRRAIKEGFSGEPLCVDGIDPATVPAPGPQPSGGDGWRLLAEGEEIRGRGRISLAADAAGYAELWVDWDAPVPEVDFEDYVVIRFVAIYSGNCPDIRLDDVVVDGDVVYPEIVNLSMQSICNLDANYHPYVVALQRSALPSGPFVIQTTAELPWSAKPEDRLTVDADLSAAGAVPEPGAVRPDASLPERTPPELIHTWPDDPRRFLLDTRCGIEWLGEVNDHAWRTNEAMPEEWEEHVDAEGRLMVMITLRVDPEPLIEAEFNNKTVLYKLADGEIPKCEQP